ncbi:MULTISPECIES: ribonuclease [unclassified Brevundimonas]|uniref:ribonuclease n=1 Tax=unclassified Brevundimonas TaxID=2622653 RepID=UPI000CFA868D|nr:MULTISPECIES: ribonuclease [unclassified Brevundimonas]PRA25904.1 ribonuclease [Brevundimonas sp. MYb27]PQZ75466.1 ribonuclease [Brevundimonas sp. MYb31]PRB11347.1 ribonuclease [Brevundimonas sp. MYb52]PRB32589.1 ribonuclease [Brevundimonas sp. MYb46]PRB41123.1 ribonuclease [Brevundimonas sp. MYb33]
MADPRTDSEEAREAAAMGEKPDRGHAQDALKRALEGSDMGSDTRAGSLRGGSASGSDIDPDQDVINEALAAEGRRAKGEGSQPAGGPAEARKSTGQPGDDVDAPTG